VLKGESSVEGAIREVKEEVGLDLNALDGRRVFTKIRESMDGKLFQDIMDVWLFEYDGELHLKEATTDEVAAGKWMSVEEIKKLYDAGKMVPSLDYFFDVFEKKEPDYCDIVGKMVTGKIDRPLGTSHPGYPDMIYPVNYGYVEGVMAKDGNEQDVYVFGSDEPLEKFTGKVIKYWEILLFKNNSFMESCMERRKTVDKIDSGYPDWRWCG